MDNFFQFGKDFFDKNWKKLINLYSNFNFEDRIILNNCCCFCVSPNPVQRSRFIFHVLIIMNAFVCEALPTKNNLQYEVKHFYWYADQNITRNIDKFYKKRNELIKRAENSIKRAIATSSEPPFTNQDWWFECENVFLGANIPIYKRPTGILAETITLFPNGNCLHNKIPRKSLGDNVQKVDIIPMPSARSCAELCHKFHQTLINPIIRREMLFQLAQDPDIPQYKEVITPAHMGWIEELELFEYIGLKSLNSEICTTGNLKETRHNNSHMLYEDLFKIVPSRISIPLLAYSIFSIIKFFISSYPSRISQQQSFKSVVKEQRKMIFMSLSGKNAQFIAKAFCGAFTRNEPSERVHDGVVIINNPPKNFIDFVNSDMIRDASVLCINPSYEKNPYEIAIKADIEFSTEDCENLQDICRSILFEFINYLSMKFINTNIDIATSPRDLISKKFEDYYLKAANLAHATKDEVRTNLNKFNKELHSDSLSTDVFFNLSKSIYDEMLENHQDVIKHQRVGGYIKKFYNIFLQESKLIISSQRQSLREKLLFTETARRTFSSAGKKYYPQKYAHLYSAMLTFCEFLKDKGVPDEKVVALKKESFEILHDLMLNREKKSAPSTFMNEYLSSLIENGKIICFRTKSSKNTGGWYDAKKQYIYLPYSSYFDMILDYWKSDNATVFPYKKPDFQKELIELNILIARKNGPSSSYFRPEHRITISPTKDKIQRKEAVLKIDVTKLSLSNDAKKILKDLSTTSISRRAPKKEKKKATATDDTLPEEENAKG